MSSTATQSSQSEEEEEPDVPYRCVSCDATNTMEYVEDLDEGVCRLCHTTEEGVFLDDYDVRRKENYTVENDGGELVITNIHVHGEVHEQPNEKRPEYKHSKRPIKYGAFPDVSHVRPYSDE